MNRRDRAERRAELKLAWAEVNLGATRIVCATTMVCATVCALFVVAPSFSSVQASFSSARSSAQTQQPQQPPIALETRADLILVDATVVDSKGVPIANIPAGEFQVTIDGVPRPLASAQFVKQDAPPATPAAAPPAHYSSNEPSSAVAGRNIIVAIDENSLAPASGRAVLASTERFLARLLPQDKVAFARLPRFEHLVDFTTDHKHVRAAIGTVVGKAQRIGAGRGVTVAESIAKERDDNFAWMRALTRICGHLQGPDYQICAQEAEADATQIYTELNVRAAETIRSLEQLVMRVRAMPGPKTMLLLSQGFVGYAYNLEIASLTRAAAASRVALYVLHLDIPSFGLADAAPSATRMGDERLMSEGVETLAGASRGARFRVVGTGEAIFERIAHELSGYYLLGIEPTAADQDGKPHKIRVTVKRTGATVRARAEFTASGAGLTAAPGSPGSRPAASGAEGLRDQLVDVLRSQTMIPGLPLRVTAFSAPGGAAGQVRVIVGADVGPPTTSAGDAYVGFVLIDGDGKVAGSEVGKVSLQPPGRGDPAPLQYVGSVEVPAGEYTLRFAAIDSLGIEGSVHRPVEAMLTAVGPVVSSDLILASPTRGSTAVRPDVHLKLTTETLQALVELSGPDGQQVADTRVTFEVADATGGPVLVSERGRLTPNPGAATPAMALLDVGVLPPGSYVARAIVNVPGQKPATLTRPFEVAPRVRSSGVPGFRGAGVPGSATEPRNLGTPEPRNLSTRGRMRPPVAAFRKEDVLASEIVRPFVDHVLQSYSLSPAAKAALEAIKAGDLQNATKGERQTSDVGMSFAQGLSMLASGKVAEADAYFRTALRQSSDFLGAAFYLGATLAAAGKDRDAVGAWQTALIGDVGAAGVYPVLIDGLLRLGEAEQALEFLQEAEPTFADRDQYTRRLAQAHALAGRYQDARLEAHEYLEKHPDDADLLFLAMHLVYEGHAAGELPDAAAEVALFRDYAQRFERLAPKTPDLASKLPIVQGWKKAIGR